MKNITKEKAEEKIRDYIKYMDNIYRGIIYSVFIYDLQNMPGKYDFLLDSCGNFIGSDINNNGIGAYLKDVVEDESLLEGILDDDGKFINK